MQTRAVQTQVSHGFVSTLEAETLRFINGCIDDGVFKAKGS
jgi:hypothetical protein